MADDTLNAAIHRRVDLHEQLCILQLAPAGWKLPAFEPGQWATIGLPDPERLDGKLIKRPYSIASAPGQDTLEFYIQHVDEGAFTGELWKLHAGDPLFLDPALRGFFTLEPVPPDKDIVLIGTGTGLAPFVSMLRHYRGRGRWRRLVIVHGARLAADLGYRDELERTASEDADVVYIPFVTREPDGAWSGLRGRVQLLLEGDTYLELVGAPLDPARCHVFLCGNPAMIDDMDTALTARGFTQHRRKQPGNLHFERYW